MTGVDSETFEYVLLIGGLKYPVRVALTDGMATSRIAANRNMIINDSKCFAVQSCCLVALSAQVSERIRMLAERLRHSKEEGARWAIWLGASASTW